MKKRCGKIRKLAEQAPDAIVRISDVQAGKPAFPLRIALTGADPGHLGEWYEAVVRQIGGAATDVDRTANEQVPRVSVVVDRERLSKKGVTIDSVMETLPLMGADVRQFGHAETAPAKGQEQDAIRSLRVRAATGELVPLGARVSVRVASGPRSIYRVALDRAVRFTANVGEGLTQPAAVARITAIANEERVRLKLPASYRVVDVSVPER